MNIKFENAAMRKCQEVWNKEDPESRILASHYDLARHTEITDHEQWLAFLKDPRVDDIIREEVEVYTRAQQRKLIGLAVTNDKSTGTAQMLTALAKVGDEQGTAGGETFIYSYVPLNEKEKRAPGVKINKKDLFLK